MRVATRLAWSFLGLFTVALALVFASLYFELVVEPESEGKEGKATGVDPPAVIVREIAFTVALPFALLAIGGWWLAHRAVRPVEVLAAATARLHEGNLTERVPLRGTGDEFDHLATVFNEMIVRLGESFQRVRQFTLYASHELKTPLAILRADIEQHSHDLGGTEAQNDHLSSQLDEIDRLTKLVDGLTLLTKADAHLIPLERQPVALAPLLRDAAEDTEAMAAELGISVNVGPCEEATVSGDRHRLRQLLVILCDNALKYNRPGGRIWFSQAADSQMVSIIIGNTGVGVPEGEHGQVFERFYRGSTVQSAGIAGCGLGLSIAQWIALEHGGTLRMVSVEDSTELFYEQPTLSALSART